MTEAAVRFSRSWRPAARRLAPLALIPAGAAYCMLSELFFSDERSGLIGSLSWAVATLGPWVVGALLFERGARSARKRSQLMVLGLGLACVAYAASGAAALWLGSGAERAFFSRLPLLGVALLGAALYPIRAPAEAAHDLAPAGDEPPVAPVDILFACAAGNYVELYTEQRTVVWRQTMRNAERVLRKAGFVRVHRSYLVPWRNIDVLVRDRKAVVEVALVGGRRLPVSSRYANNLADQTLQ
ncbi:LytTR family DNA-binding domain-containing protein [Sphingomonas koreensis]